jgi:ER lumen protein retaining receptor
MSMNLFRLAGDACHLASKLLLLYKLRSSQNAVGKGCNSATFTLVHHTQMPDPNVVHFVHLCPTCAAGISLKTQKLLLIAYCCRYQDQFFLYLYHSFYGTCCLQLLCIALTFSTIMLIRFHHVISTTYEKSKDSFPIFRLALLPCLVLLVLQSYYEIDERFGLEVSVQLLQARLWQYSLYVEALAVLPQLLVMEVRLFTVVCVVKRPYLFKCEVQCSKSTCTACF